jgi:hypothetical protein
MKQKKIKKENIFLRFIKKYWKLIKIFVTLIFSYIIANQVVQPLFFPRISSITVTPLFIQGNPLFENNSIYKNTDYYLVSKLTYKIDVPLFPCFPILGSDKISLELPRSISHQNKIFLLSGFLESNPYITYIPPFYINSSFISYEELGGQILIQIKKWGFDLRQIDVNLYVAEKLENPQPSLGASMPRWWSNENIQPFEQFQVTRGYGNLLGYMQLKDNETFVVYEYFIKNLGNLKVRGYNDVIYGNEYFIVCEGNIQLFGYPGKDSQVIFIDLQPGEMKRLLVIKKVDKRTILSDYPLYEIPTLHCPFISKIFT